ncbi:methionine biosynthesis protein MetW [Aquabacterium sp.]|uniref:class I SAM-dependent methyltransferase n=1 Tax=Aquabacterium sp. TaxID=1872578 RepID=UPI002488255F|nr:methionine biosynthesis protein MetW [Aquabacterium sp.]MDI1259393.1 methionine biosynthesis protein MetW [Aquabacterium sp.]
MLRSLKEAWSLFSKRPRIRISNVDYNAYWEVKRDGNFGTLNHYQINRIEWIADRIEPGDTVLDMGCGDGAAIMALAKLIKISALAADIAEKPLEFLNSQGIRAIKCDLLNLTDVVQLPVCDHVLLLEVIEHFRDAEALIQAALTRAGKALFFSVPNTGYFPYRLRLLSGRFPAQWRTHPGEHLRFWTVADMKWWLQELGLDQYCEIHCYQGLPILNKIMPGFFAAAMVVRIDKRRLS